MKLSIIVPVFNEQVHLAEIVDFLMASPCPLEREWIFVDDCSTVNSRKILHEMEAKYFLSGSQFCPL